MRPHLADAHICAEKVRHQSSSLRRRPESRPCGSARRVCLDPGLRRDDNVFESRQTQVHGSCDDVIPTFIAPAKAGGQAYARSARRVFAWIPAYAGTTMYLSLAESKRTVLEMM